MPNLSVGFLCCILVSGAVYGDEVYSALGEVCRLGGLDLESGDVAVCAPGLSCIYNPNNDYKGYCMPLCSNLTYTRPQYENDYDMTFVTHGWDYASGDSGQLRTLCALSEDGGGVSGNSVSAYRCDNDYYGDIGLGSPAVCSECPDGGEAFVTNNTSVTDCYKYSGHDVSGTFTFKGKKCYYTTE